jgi:hypothetical protein
VSFLEGNGTPSLVQRCMIRPPSARIGPITPEERKAVLGKSPVKGKYDQAVDSESAYEVLQKRVKETGSTAAPAPGQENGGQASAGGGILGGIGSVLGSIFGLNKRRGERFSTGQLIARSVTRTVTNQVAGQIAADIGKSIGGKMGGSVGRAIVRGTMGGILRR